MGRVRLLMGLFMLMDSGITWSIHGTVIQTVVVVVVVVVKLYLMLGVSEWIGGNPSLNMKPTVTMGMLHSKAPPVIVVVRAIVTAVVIVIV